MGHFCVHGNTNTQKVKQINPTTKQESLGKKSVSNKKRKTKSYWFDGDFVIIVVCGCDCDCDCCNLFGVVFEFEWLAEKLLLLACVEWASEMVYASCLKL
eukprot:c4506_g1_i1.p2 GENE.c4506_g1_i1~~c4506_g1_i1.p2  ORF type:complete len:100 (+),score=20.39 c4506_g1_i1:398-697(+)